jgi:hypothetical protein
MDRAVSVAQPIPLASLAERGWTWHVPRSRDRDTVLSEIRQIGDMLGTRAVGRADAYEEMVRPQTPIRAHPRSLSSRYGLGALPFHVELSHRPRPCRYLLLGCLDAGTSNAATTLVDWRTFGFTSDELGLLEDAPILVRTGRRSFYSTVLPRDHSFLRYDPACVEAVDKRGHSALRLLEQRLSIGSPHVHRWCQGDVLIIDNWRILHGRGPSDHDTDRCLARILIDA